MKIAVATVHKIEMEKDAPMSPSSRRITQEQETNDKGWWEKFQDGVWGGVTNLVWSESKRTESSTATNYCYGSYGRVHPLQRWF